MAREDAWRPRALLIGCRPIDIRKRIIGAVSKRGLQRFGTRLRAERERVGISQEALADLAGLHRTYVGGVERGERNVGLLNIIRLARALGVSPATLLADLNTGGGQ
jgi:DNA-binding XRE family transcriptional regulator